MKPLLCTYRARRTSWGWWDEWDDTALQTEHSTFWRPEAEHATSRSRRLPTILSKVYRASFEYLCYGSVIMNIFITGIDLSRQNLTSSDVRFWRLKSIPRCKGYRAFGDPPIIDRSSVSRPATRWQHPLTLTALKYLYINHGNQRVFSIWNRHKCLI